MHLEARRDFDEGHVVRDRTGPSEWVREDGCGRECLGRWSVSQPLYIIL